MDRRFALAALVGALPVAVALGPRPAAAQLLGSGMDEFRMRALAAGELSAQTSRIAAERSRSSRVRQFAELEAAEQAAYAAALGARPGAVALRDDQVEIIEQLNAASGSSFDRLYLSSQISGHDELLQLNQTFAQGGTDTVGRAVAVLAVPAIRTHLAMLDMLQR